jgi:hypothetical protein
MRHIQEFGLVGFLAHNLQAQYAKARLTLGVRAQKNLGPTLGILGLLFGPKLLINATTLMSGY